MSWNCLSRTVCFGVGSASVLVSGIFVSNVLAAENIPAAAFVCVVSTYVFNESEQPSYSCDGQPSVPLQRVTTGNGNQTDQKQETSAQYLKFLKLGYKLQAVANNDYDATFTAP
jgi:hypothetical protein